jgi:forkhead box protein N
MLPTVNWLTALSTSLSPLKADVLDVGRRCRRRLAAPYKRTPYSVPRYYSEGTDHTDDGEVLDANRPSFSFTCLIGLAILSSQTKQLTVGSIYEYVQLNFPYFKTARSTWRNSVRHVLSLNKFFQKPDDGKQSSKGGVWMVKPLMLTLLVEHIAEGQQRLPAATAKHLGLPELKRFIVKSRIGKVSRQRRTSSASSSSGLSRATNSRSSLNASSSSLGSSLGMGGLSMAPPPPPPLEQQHHHHQQQQHHQQPVVQVPLAPLELQLDIAPEPFSADRTYECPSPALSAHSDCSSSSSFSSSSAAIVPDLADMDADAWAFLPDYNITGGDEADKFAESAMIDQMLAKLAAEDALLAGADSSAQLVVIGEGIQAPHGFSGLALL